MKVLRKLESLLLAAGFVLLGFYIAVRIQGTVIRRAEFRTFKKQISDSRYLRRPLSGQIKPDFSLWSPKRIEDYQSALEQYAEIPLAVLRIAKVRFEVPVLSGTNDLSLNVGIGHIAGTVLPAEEGNIGIAGHRDGFLRVLKDVSLGEEIELPSQGRTATYAMDRIVLVSTDDVSVLQRRSRLLLTLVTRYPCYFIGSAPKRDIVQALLTSSEPLNSANG